MALTACISWGSVNSSPVMLSSVVRWPVLGWMPPARRITWEASLRLLSTKAVLPSFPLMWRVSSFCAEL